MKTEEDIILEHFSKDLSEEDQYRTGAWFEDDEKGGTIINVPYGDWDSCAWGEGPRFSFSIPKNKFTQQEIEIELRKEMSKLGITTKDLKTISDEAKWEVQKMKGLQKLSPQELSLLPQIEKLFELGILHIEILFGDRIILMSGEKELQRTNETISVTDYSNIKSWRDI